MLGFVVGLDLHGLAVSAGHAVALAFGSLDDELDTAIVSKSLVQLESECGATANDCGGGRTLYPGECRRRGHDGTTELHDPEVEPLEKVQSGNLALCAEHRFGILRKGSLVPREDLLVGERFPHGGQALENALLKIEGISDIDFDIDNYPNHIKITTHKRIADEFNMERLEELPDESYYFEGDIDGDFHQKDFPEKLLFQGQQICHPQ